MQWWLEDGKFWLEFGGNIWRGRGWRERSRMSKQSSDGPLPMHFTQEPPP